MLQQYPFIQLLPHLLSVFCIPQVKREPGGLTSGHFGEGRGEGLGEGRGEGLGEGFGEGLGEGLGEGPGEGPGDGPGTGPAEVGPNGVPEPTTSKVIGNPGLAGLLLAMTLNAGSQMSK